jgi:hypothetical protein
MLRLTIEHEPTDACQADHCWWHNVDEPGTGYITCPECGHLYRTARELRRAYRRQLRNGRRWGIPRWRILLRALTIRAKKISFCQECIHDF